MITPLDNLGFVATHVHLIVFKDLCFQHVRKGFEMKQKQIVKTLMSNT